MKPTITCAPSGLVAFRRCCLFRGRRVWRRQLTWGLAAWFLATPVLCPAQVSGNAAFAEGGGRTAAEQLEQKQRELPKDQQPPSATSTFVEASVLMNVKADEYVAVFALAQEGETLEACNQKHQAMLESFLAELKSLAIDPRDVYVDFIAQHRVYGYEKQGDLLIEKLSGFDLKKNVSIRFRDAALLEKLTLAAARCQIFDLVKVDYIVLDLPAVKEKLLDEAARVIQSKRARYEKMLGIRLVPPAQVYAEKSLVHYPTRMYDSYMAAESEQIDSPYRHDNRHYVQQARKNRTFYLNSLDGSQFDSVMNPVITEPVVQCTLYLKIKYEVEQPPNR